LIMAVVSTVGVHRQWQRFSIGLATGAVPLSASQGTANLDPVSAYDLSPEIINGRVRC